MLTGCKNADIEKVPIKGEQKDSKFYGSKLTVLGNNLVLNYSDGFKLFDSDLNIVFSSENELRGLKKPLLYNAWIIIQSTDEIFSYDIHSQKLKWTYPVNVNYTNVPYISGGVLELVVHSNEHKKLLSVRIENGQAIKEQIFSTLTKSEDIYPYVEVKEKIIIVSSYRDSTIYGYSKNNLETLLWRIPLQRRSQSGKHIVTSDRHLFLVEDSTLKCIDITSGQLINTYNADSPIELIECKGQYIYVFTRNKIYALKANTLKKQYEVEAVNADNQSIQGDKLIFFSGKTLKIQELETGESIKEIILNSVTNTSNAVHYNDAYIFVSNEGELIRIKE